MKFILVFIFIAFQAIFGAISAQDLVVDRVAGVSGSDNVADMLKQKDGGLLIAGTKGIYKLYKDDDFASSFSKKSNTIAIVANAGGDVYSAHADLNILKNNERIFNISDSDTRIYDMALHKSKLWIASSKGLYCINTKTSKLIKKYTTANSALISDHINFVFNDKNDVLWAGTNKGLVRIKKDKWKNYEEDAKFLAIAENDEGTWIVADKELWLIDKANRWYPAALNKGLFKGSINDIVLDKDGNLYVASEVLVKFNPYENIVEQWGNTIGLVAQKCLSLETDPSGAIYVGTANAGLYKIYMGETSDKKLSILAIVEKELLCKNDTGASLMVEAFGGTAPYQYTWDAENLEGNNPKGLQTGSYGLTVTDSTGQQVSQLIAIEEPASFELVLNSKRAVSDISQNDGYADISISGGTYPYTISWDSGEEGTIAKKLKHGENNITVVDANDCIWKSSVLIEKPKLLPDLSMDKLELGQTLQIEDLFFNADSTNISERNFGLLEEIYQFLASNKGVVIEIGGHTNSIPPDDYCDKLSSSRAKNVAQFLYDLGIEDGRIAYKGYGKRAPVASNETMQGRKKNQRVEIKILNLE